MDIDYYGVEAFPISSEEWAQLKYPKALEAEDLQKQFNLMHESAWETIVPVSDTFRLMKQKKQFAAIADLNLFHLIYFDAFGARVQPELWTEDIFGKMFAALRPNGVLVTYAAKGSVRRAMQAVGFVVERLPGPPGKREMLRATKPNLADL